jgi:predicted transcriptional regulator
MQNEDISQMPVVSEGHIVGMIARFLQTRLRSGRIAEQ